MRVSVCTHGHVCERERVPARETEGHTEPHATALHTRSPARVAHGPLHTHAKHVTLQRHAAQQQAQARKLVRGGRGGRGRRGVGVGGGGRVVCVEGATSQRFSERPRARLSAQQRARASRSCAGSGGRRSGAAVLRPGVARAGEGLEESRGVGERRVLLEEGGRWKGCGGWRVRVAD
eukprot:1232999-Rhodomonas_salina.1